MGPIKFTTACAVFLAAVGLGSARAAGPPSVAASASPPGFDCARAASAREKAICADAPLSALDGELGRLYRERLARLSPQGARLLQGSQRSWLSFVDTVCSSADAGGSSLNNQISCLTSRYKDRLAQVRQVARRRGPYIINRVDLYAARPSYDTSGSPTGFYISHVGYPQVDDPAKPEIVAWNKASSRRLPASVGCDSGKGDYDLDYDLGYANARIISLQWLDETSCHGTPHGEGHVAVANTVLSNPLRPLVPADLFGPGKSWAAGLKARLWAALMRSGWRPQDNQPNVKRDLERGFVQPDQWLFTEGGLQVAFSSYDGGCYACTPQPITLPWSELRPLLSKDALVP